MSTYECDSCKAPVAKKTGSAVKAKTTKVARVTKAAASKTASKD